MSLIPSVKLGSVPTLQRSYFTSQLFVNAARSDVETLLSKFDYAVEDEPQPFAIFKRIWVTEGWNHAHLFIWEDAARDEYLKTIFRLFIERLNEEEDQIFQLGAVFALYTFYELQAAATNLHKLLHVPIPIDILQHAVTLIQNSEGSHRPYLIWILQHFLSQNVFHVLPPSNQKPYNPIELPHSFIVRKDDERVTSQSLIGKGKGAKSGTRQSRDRYGRSKWQTLSSWVDERAGNAAASSSVPRSDSYSTLKADLLDMLPEDVERTAEHAALAKLKTLASAAEGGTNSEGVERYESMLKKDRGILRDQWE